MVVWQPLNEGSFTEDEVAACYLGGVLASSKTKEPRDDRGVYFNAQISRLSVFQIRLHYVVYAAFHALYQGVEHRNSDPVSLEIGLEGLLVGMGYLQDMAADATFDPIAASHHALFGLYKEQLIGDWRLENSSLTCEATYLGKELFLWANGKGKRPVAFFYDRAFEHNTTGLEDVILLKGRTCPVRILGTEETSTMRGFDFPQHLIHSGLTCPIDNSKLVSTSTPDDGE